MTRLTSLLVRAGARRPPVQRKADESTAQAALGYRRPRIGIDVAPVAARPKEPR